MARQAYLKLSRRERQIMDIIYRNGSATAAEIRSAMADPPSYSAVRAKLSIMEDKGYVAHRQDGPRYVYYPVVKRESAEQTAVSHLMATFFDNSVEKAITALFEHNESQLSDAELSRLAELIEKTRGADHD